MRWTAVSLFTLAGITDFFDGYLARRANQVSRLGRFLDPIADKLLVASVLLVLVGFNRVEQWTYVPAIIIMLREILVSGLREFLAELHVGVPVTKLAKGKTTVQMIALGFLIVGTAVPLAKPTGEVLLWLAALLTIITGYDYLKAGLKHMSEPAQSKPADTSNDGTRL